MIVNSNQKDISFSKFFLPLQMTNNYEYETLATITDCHSDNGNTVEG